MGRERLNRQLDIVNYDELNFPIHIIGCGGIGSWATLAVAKMGCRDITVYDFDNVEDHNVASQFFKEAQLDTPKVEALAENVLEQTGVVLKTTTNVIEEEYIDSGVVIIAVDSMKERIKIGSFLRDKDVYIIDGRMGGIQFEVYNVHSSRYETTLVDPEGVSHEVCTAKAISFNCMVIGGMIANAVRHYAKKTSVDNEINFDFENIILLKSAI